MDYKDINVPFLDSTKIRKKADLFRKSFWGESIPVDIERIIDLRLKLDIIPIKNLQNFCDTDALITSNWKSVYIDYDKYLDERYYNRLRFSLAHEIGHFVLHKDIYSNLNIKNIKDFYKLIDQISPEQYSYLETQANKFANYLLVAREKLIIEKEKILEKYRNEVFFRKIDNDTLNSYIAIPISKIFGVSEEVVEIALNKIDNN